MFEFSGVKINFDFKLGSLINIRRWSKPERRNAPEPVGPARFRLDVLILPEEKRVEVAKIGGQDVWEWDLAKLHGLSVSELRKIAELDLAYDGKVGGRKLMFDASKGCWMVHTTEGSLPFMDYLTRDGMAAYADLVESGGVKELGEQSELSSTGGEAGQV